jgi:hypothetical protein
MSQGHPSPCTATGSETASAGDFLEVKLGLANAGGAGKHWRVSFRY